VNKQSIGLSGCSARLASQAQIMKEKIAQKKRKERKATPLNKARPASTRAKNKTKKKV
jgi:hypothetical protein